jgi:type VI secretion system protein ImpH
MALRAEKWREHISVMQRLLDEPHRFDFVQAVRLFEQCLRNGGMAPEQALERYLRFDNSLSLAFPSSQIEALTLQSDTPIDDDVSLLNAARDNALKHIRITPTFLGFLGAHGVMPIHYTELLARDAQIRGDQGPRAFLDSFSHRSLVLFYQAMQVGHIECSRDADGNDGFLPLQLALAGHAAQRSGQAPVPEKHPIPPEVIAYYAALIRQRGTSAPAIAQVLSDYFNVSISVEQFGGAMEPLSAAEQTRLGLVNCRLSGGAMLGERYAHAGGRVRLMMGPLGKRDFERFLPGDDGAVALNSMLTLFASAPVQFEVRLLLRAEEISGISLLRPGQPGAARLGCDAFLITQPQQSDRQDAGYLLNPMNN